MKYLAVILISMALSVATYAQTETLTNQTIIELSRSGLSVDLILKKISTSRTSFDVSAQSLIDLRKAGVDDAVIALMMESTQSNPQPTPAQTNQTRPQPVPTLGFSESSPYPDTKHNLLTSAKTIAFGKSSIQPSRQALEKELLKRNDFRALGLTILRYKEEADLFVDIGFVSGSIITHRYVYRIYDRRSGAVIAAGETTSWGSLAENLARHISKRLTVLRG
jgi:hypothetical protein